MTNHLAGSRPAEILLAEDNENDVVLTREGFKKCKLALNLHHVKDGEECMAFLQQAGQVLRCSDTGPLAPRLKHAPNGRARSVGRVGC